MPDSGRREFVILVAVTQFGLEQLARRGMRKIGNDDHIIGHPPLRNLAIEIIKNALFRYSCAVFFTHQQKWPLIPFRVMDANAQLPTSRSKSDIVK